MESIVQEVSNIGFTLLCVVISVVSVRWLDKNIFNKGRNNEYNK